MIELGADLKSRRVGVFASLRAAGIGVAVHYIPVHLQPYYRSLGFQAGDFPVAENYYAAGAVKTSQKKMCASWDESYP